MKCALITGASSGIGAETAKLLSRKGYRVIMVARNLERLKSVAAQLDGPRDLMQCNLENSDEVAMLVDEIMSSGKKVKVLVNNAGSIVRRPFEETPMSEWIRQFQLCLSAPVVLTKGLLPALEASKGHIVNISSSLGLRPIAGTAAYSALKSAMINWSQSLAIELAPLGIKVNCVCPGIIDTPIHGLEDTEEKAGWSEQLSKVIPLKRVGEPQDVAKAIAFYASDDSNWTTGNVHVIDGGLSLV